ncbi:MAG TPA: energy transducer TonB [Terriglobia bacterium]|nr:energy transducer TonB [Terriglobia bacterium]
MGKYLLRFVLTGVAAACFLAPALAAKDQAAPVTAAALFARARAVSNIEGAGSQPFSLQVSVTVYRRGQAPAEGDYDLSWASAGKWRRESSFSNYHEISVGEGEKVWHMSNASYRPFFVFQTSHALDFFRRLEIPPGATVGNVSALNRKAGALSCVEYQTKSLKRHTFCFSPATGYLASESDSEWLTTYHYQDYFLTNGRAFPRTIRVFQKGHLILQARVANLAFEPSFRASLFDPPAGPHLRDAPACDAEQLTDPRKISGSEAQYPQDALHSKKKGAVQLYADIGANGRVRGLTVLQSPGSDFSRAATEAVRQWSFAPARCGGVPVETTIAIIIHFSVQ